MNGRTLIKERRGPKPNERHVGIGLVPGRKRPSLYIGNEWSSYVVATFSNEEAAQSFMDFMSDFVGAVKEETHDPDH